MPLAIARWSSLIGVGLGLLNGVLTAYLRIPSFITTLAALSAFRGVAFMFNNGSPVFQVSPLLEPIFYGTLVGLPLPLFYVVALYALAFWFLRYTALGRSIYAVGGNPNAARLSGIDVRRIQLAAFVDRRADGGDRRRADGGAAQLRLARTTASAWSFRRSPRR